MKKLQSIENCLSAKYGVEATTLVPLSAGADMRASVFKAETREGLSYFLKLKEGHDNPLAVRVLAFLHASGIQEIIPPIQTADGELVQKLADSTLLVYPFVEGKSGFCTNLTDEQWVTLGKVLRQVHELDVPESIQKQMRKERFSPQWREAVRSLDLDRKVSGDEAATKLQACMQAHREEIRRLVDRAESLSHKIPQSAKYVLCHADIHGGNVLIDRHGGLFIIDWDGPIMAPKERDLMFIGGGVANRWNQPHEEAFFYQGYGKTQIDQTLLAYYRHERILEDIVEYSHALLRSDEGGEERLTMYSHFENMFQPNGVVDIAFNTYD